MMQGPGKSESQGMETAPAEQLSGLSPFSRNGYHPRTRPASIDSNGSNRSSAAGEPPRGSFTSKRLSDVCEDLQMDGSQQPSPHQPRAQSHTGVADASEEAGDGGKGILGWIKRFTTLGRRTQSSIDMPVAPKLAADVLHADVPRRSYSESELGPRRRAACEFVRPSAEAGTAEPHSPCPCSLPMSKLPYVLLPVCCVQESFSMLVHASLCPTCCLAQVRRAGLLLGSCRVVG